MVWPLDESQGSTPLQGHDSWLVCEMALSTPSNIGYISKFFTYHTHLLRICASLQVGLWWNSNKNQFETHIRL